MGQLPQPGSATTNQKCCIICGADCTGKPRVKDPRGRYFCRPCYDARSPAHAEAARSPVGSTEPLDAVLPADDFLLAEPLYPTVVAPGHGSVPWPPTSTSKGAKAKSKTPRAPAMRPGQRIAHLLLMPPFGPFAPYIAFAIAMALYIGDALGRGPRFALMMAEKGATGSWGDVYLFGVLGGVVGGLISWYLGPFVYRLRLKWSGGDDIEPISARVIYFFSSVPAALWVVGAALMLITASETPKDALMASVGPSAFAAGVALVLLLAAGCVITFLTAWQAFDASAGRAAFWFLAVPFAWYGLSLASLSIVLASGTLDPLKSVQGGGRAPSGRSVVIAPPNTAQPKLHEHSALLPDDFRYPGNWTVSEHAAPTVEFRMLQVAAPDGSEFVMLLVSPAEIEVDEEFILDNMTKGLAKGARLSAPEPITALGRFNGQGRVYTGVISGRPARIVLFVRPVANARRLVVAMIRPEPDQHSAERGFELILQSLKVTAQ